MARSSVALLRSLAWLRWRIVYNTLTRSGARDTLERLSRTAESVLPLAIVVMLLPLAVVLAVVGGYTGWLLAGDPAAAAWPMVLVRWTLLIMFAITVLSPVILSGTQQGAGTVRLMLLPIPGRVLYLAHAAGALADPWVFLSIPLFAGLSAGLAASGRIAAAVLTALAGLACLVALLGVAALASAILQLLVRNRQRSEAFALAGMLLIVIISILPSILFTEADIAAPDSRRRHDHVQLAEWIRVPGRVLPSELYVAATREAAAPRAAPALANTIGVAAWAIVLHGLTWPIYHRLLQTPATTGTRRRTGARRLRTRALPLVGPAVSAVALTFARLAFRTPRGRSSLLMPLVLLAGFAAISVGRGTTIPFGPVAIGGGYSLGSFGVVLALMSIGPLVFNQFAVDRAGLTLEFLAPIGTRALLYGKALGGALMAAVPCALAILIGIVTGGHSPAIWAIVILAACASYLLTAPVAAVLSLIFPRAVDLSSIGQASNAHQAAGLLGFLAFALSCAPPVALAMAGFHFLESTAGAIALVGAWTLVSAALSWAGFRIAERLLDERRENLALVAQGR